MTWKPDLSLYRYLTKKHYRGVVRDRPPNKISALYINLNDILYETAAQVYSFDKYHNYRRISLLAQTKPEELKVEHQNAVFTMLTNIITTLLPGDVLVLTIDGVVIDGKLPALRKRGYATNGNSFFDPNSINVGTPFMAEMENALQRWILANRAGILPKTIISLSDIPGEGRHKIFEFIRTNELKAESKAKTHVVYSCDDSNIMSALLAQKEFKRDSSIVLADNSTFTRNIDVNTLLTLIDFITDSSLANNMNKGTEDEARVAREKEKDILDRKLQEHDRKTPVGKRVHDFVLLHQLWRNPDLPQSPALYDLSFDTMIGWYQTLNKPLTDQGQIIPAALTDFCSIMAQHEMDLLNSRLAAHIRHPFLTLRRSLDRRGKAVDFSAFRGAWYGKMLAPREEGDVKMMEELTGLPFPKQITEEFLFDLFEEYITGIYWCYAYQHNRGVSRWSYPYLYAPLLQDLHWALSRFNASKGEGHNIPSSAQLGPRSVFVQSLATIPTRSREQIAEPVQAFTTLKSDIFDLFPYTVQFDVEGTENDDEKVVILPPLDIYRLEESLDEVALPAQKVGKPLVFDLDATQMAAREKIINRLIVQERHSHEHREERPHGHFHARGRGRGEGRGRGRGRGEGRGRGRGRGGRGRGTAPGMYTAEYPS